jgi:hypothetical protein
MNIVSYRDPAYVSADRSLIHVWLNTVEYGEIPYGANANDVEHHGRQIHAMIVSGAAQVPIAAYVSQVTVMATAPVVGTNHAAAPADPPVMVIA